jgi:hypothetical protein
MADELGRKLGLRHGSARPLRSLTEASRWGRSGIISAYLTSLSHTIAGGTSEVLRTTVATRGLGLPSER